ncbi:kinase-like protein [Gonapodya prolifera JEL478]|uniref:Kinase-like protein n=1 Tax=Gonapodya prolifera (strain JEL478) TaxID=1344416 RepID=A0A139ACA2_GONPJ|nr:kinase-like protein [Gonapodya prolifera JEL478]|eukprot:KXS14400.1 kinase-like protein [Gonapodya prolifera JEL478]
MESADMARADAHVEVTQLWIEIVDAFISAGAPKDAIQSTFRKAGRACSPLRGTAVAALYRKWAAFERAQGDPEKAIGIEQMAQVVGGSVSPSHAPFDDKENLPTKKPSAASASIASHPPFQSSQSLSSGAPTTTPSSTLTTPVTPAPRRPRHERRLLGPPKRVSGESREVDDEEDQHAQPDPPRRGAGGTAKAMPQNSQETAYSPTGSSQGASYNRSPLPSSQESAHSPSPSEDALATRQAQAHAGRWEASASLPPSEGANTAITNHRPHPPSRSSSVSSVSSLASSASSASTSSLSRASASASGAEKSDSELASPVERGAGARNRKGSVSENAAAPPRSEVVSKPAEIDLMEKEQEPSNGSGAAVPREEGSPTIVRTRPTPHPPATHPHPTPSSITSTHPLPTAANSNSATVFHVSRPAPSGIALTRDLVPPVKPQLGGPDTARLNAAAAGRRPSASQEQEHRDHTAPRAGGASASDVPATPFGQAPRKDDLGTFSATVGSTRGAIKVNGTTYTKLSTLGRGGSSKVYKVLSPNGQVLALKKVSIRGADRSAVEGYVNEIRLLKKLRGNSRIIGMTDWEVDERGAVIFVVMECGDADLAHVLRRAGQRPTLNQVRMFWEQMLQAVKALHEESIVHTDLKPANFLMVEGGLKLIDFGIAKAIPNDTTNIHRDHQTGTVNYMSPESITDISGQRRDYLKIGRPSDVWSLGCILYELLHGRPPFFHLSSMVSKLQAIIDPKFVIPYPDIDEHASDAAEMKLAWECVRGCLKRDPKERMTIGELLGHPFLSGVNGAATSPSKSTLDEAALVQQVVSEVLKAFRPDRVNNYEQVSSLIVSQLRRGLPVDLSSLKGK